MRFTTKVLPSRSGNVGIIELNNPKILNSLTLEMVHALQDIYTEWQSSSSPLKAILLKACAGATTKKPIFCAGGDVKSIALEGLKEQKQSGSPSMAYAMEFFKSEYTLDHTISQSKIPQVSLWDGVVMGGGVGISIHGMYRVATENTLFAMPETAIGLFPDVGSMYWMTHTLCPTRHVGVAQYLGLTGARLRAHDLVYTGLATHYIPSHKMQDLQQALVQASLQDGDHDIVVPVLNSFHESPPQDPSTCFLATHEELIQTVFQSLAKDDKTTVNDIFQRLQQHANNSQQPDSSRKFAQETLETLQKMSPTSLKLTLEGLYRGYAMPTLGDDLSMELTMARACMRPGSDFYEGVRAVLIDKDSSPKWSPSTIDEVTDDMVQSHFVPLDDTKWNLPTTVDANSKL